MGNLRRPLNNVVKRRWHSNSIVDVTANCPSRFEWTCEEIGSKSLSRFRAMNGCGQHLEFPNDQRWIRFERYTRYHAIYALDSGLYWTYCGRSVRVENVNSNVDVPPARCGCCRSRLIRPYLLPERMMRLKETGVVPFSGPDGRHVRDTFGW